MHCRLPALLLTLACAAAAQEPVEPAHASHLPPVVTLMFPGGTLDKFVAAVRTAEPRANIVLAEAAAAAKLPPIELRGAGLHQALEGAAAVAEAEFVVRVQSFDGPGQTVYSIVAIAEKAQPFTAEHQQQAVLSLNELTTDRGGLVRPLSVETILSAIELATTNELQAPTVRFHRDSGLVVVRGVNEQIGRAMEVLRALTRDQDELEKRARTARAAPPAAGGEPKKGEKQAK